MPLTPEQLRALNDPDAPLAIKEEALAAYAEEKRQQQAAEAAQSTQEVARAKPSRDEVEYAVLADAQGAGGAAGDYARTILNPKATSAELEQKRKEHDKYRPIGTPPTGDDIWSAPPPGSYVGGDDNPDLIGIFGPNQRSNERAASQRARWEAEARVKEDAKRLGLKSRDEMIDAIQAGKLSNDLPDPRDARKRSEAALAGSGVGGAVGTASAAAVGGGRLPPAEDPIELRANVNIANIKTPAAYASELRSMIASGEITPAEASKRSVEYKKWYASAIGKTTRAEGLDVQGKIAEAQGAIDRQLADADTAERLTALNANAAERAAAMDEAQRQGEEAYQRAMARHAVDYGEFMDRIEHANVEPFSGEGGAAKQAGFVIALIAGGLQQALTGKPNTAIPLADRAIDAELKKQDIMMRRGAIAAQGKMNIMQMARATFADSQQAFLAAKKAMYEQLGARVQNELATADTDEQRARAQQALEELQRNSEKTQLLFEARTDALAQQDRMRLIAGAGAAAASRVAGSVSSGAERYSFKQSDKSVVKAENYSRPFNGFFYDKSAKAEYEKNLTLRNELLGQMIRVRAIRAVHGSTTSPEARARQETILNNAASLASVKGGQGAQTNPEFGRFVESVGDGKIDILGVDMAKLDQYIDMIRREQDVYLNSAGVVPGQPPDIDPRTGEAYITLNVDPEAVRHSKENGKDVFTVKTSNKDAAAGARAPDITPGPEAEQPQRWRWR